MTAGERADGPVRILLLDDDSGYAEALGRQLYRSAHLHLLSAAVREQELPALVADLAPDVILIDHPLGHGSGIDAVDRAVKRFCGIPVVLIADEPTPAVWREAVARGARTVLRKDLSEPDLAAAVRDVLALQERELSRIRSGHAPGSTAGGGPALLTRPPQVVAVFSPKGGVGKSTIATNLAVWVQANPFQRVPTALCELEVGAGTTHTLLGLPASPTLLDWGDFSGEAALDPAVVRGLVVEHPGTRLHCVFAADSASVHDGAEPSVELVRTVLRSLQLTHAVTIVDCAPVLTPAVTAALELATTVLLVVELGAPAIGKVRRVVGRLEAAGLNLSKFRLVMNRMPPHPDWSPGQVQEALPFPVIGRIREDPQVSRAGNRAHPPAQSAPNGPFMHGVRTIADRLLPGTGFALADRGWRSNLLARLIGARG